MENDNRFYRRRVGGLNEGMKVWDGLSSPFDWSLQREREDSKQIDKTGTTNLILIACPASLPTSCAAVWDTSDSSFLLSADEDIEEATGDSAAGGAAANGVCVERKRFGEGPKRHCTLDWIPLVLPRNFSFSVAVMWLVLAGILVNGCDSFNDRNSA